MFTYVPYVPLYQRAQVSPGSLRSRSRYAPKGHKSRQVTPFPVSLCHPALKILLRAEETLVASECQDVSRS